MGVMDPLAIVTTASITSLARMTLYHHSIRVYHAEVETHEDMAVLGERPGTPRQRSPSPNS